MTKAQRDSIVVLAASLVSHAGNFAFYILAVRILGDESWALLASCVAAGLIVTLPASGVASYVATTLAGSVAPAQRAQARHRCEVTLRRSAFALGGLTLAGFACAGPGHAVWGSDLSAWNLAVVWVMTTGFLQITIGAAQGLGRFGTLAAVLAGPFGIFRPVAMIASMWWFGTTLSAALVGLIIATVIGLFIVIAGCSRGYRHATAPAPEALRRSRHLAAYMVALCGFGALLNADVLIAPLVMGTAEAAVYATAATFGKVAFHAPSALAFVVLPTLTARIAAREPFQRLAARAHVFAGVIAAVVVALLGVLPLPVWSLLLGEAAPHAHAWSWLIGACYAIFAVAYMTLQVHLAQASNRAGVLYGLLGLAACGALVVFGNSVQAMVLAVACTSFSTLVAGLIMLRVAGTRGRAAVS